MTSVAEKMESVVKMYQVDGCKFEKKYQYKWQMSHLLIAKIIHDVENPSRSGKGSTLTIKETNDIKKSKV